MKRSMIDTGGFWAGTDSSFDQFTQLAEVMAEKMAAGHTFEDEEDEELPYLLSVEDGVARIEINGPMVNSNDPFNRYFGITNYSDIREALVSAANNSEVHSILMDMNTGGGQVSGVSDVSDLVSMVDKNIKPIYAFTSGTVASAGYWIAVNAREIHVTESAMVGSIGVIATHMEKSKMLEEMGIKATVMRAGKYKALASPYEPLSEEAKAQVQDGLEHTYKLFVGHVSEELGVPYDYVDANMAQGREFYGAQTVAVGLTTAVTSFDDLLSKIKANSIDKGIDLSNNSRNSITGFQMKTALNTAPKVEASSEAPTIEAQVEQKSDLLSFLQDQVASKDVVILEANMKVKELEAKVSDQSAAFAGLIKIAADSINTMQVALKGASVDASAMSATQILAEHARVQETFQKQFPVGGVASVDAAAEPVENEPQKLDPHYAARIAATRF